MLLFHNATISINRASYNATTKQSTESVVQASVPAYIQDLAEQFALRGVAAADTLRLIVDATVDLRDLDQITGYTPQTRTKPMIYTVQHVELHQGLLMAYKSAMLKGMAE
jgi:hypothetical protein